MVHGAWHHGIMVPGASMTCDVRAWTGTYEEDPAGGQGLVCVAVDAHGKLRVTSGVLAMLWVYAEA